MQGIASPPIEKRLKSRYLKLVQAHMHSATELASGIASLPSTATAFAATQGAWRFLNNERVTAAALAEPLRQVGRDRLAETKAPFGLLIHDWSKLGFVFAASKRDLTRVTHGKDLGYELTAALLVSGDDGRPMAPMELHLKTGGGVLSTRARAPRHVKHLDQVLPTMKAARAWGLGKPMVHVIDREADSVAHWRQWSADGHLALVRADDRKVLRDGAETSLRAIAEGLGRDGAFKDAGEALYHGRKARLFIAEAAVVLHRPGKRNQGPKKVEVPGPPLALRLVVTEVRDLKGRALARWLLLTNVAATQADAATIARWYYFRWRIESFHKLLKKAGWHLEGWLQRTGERLLIKLLIALGACASVWALERRSDAESAAFQALLMQLSGRQTKRDRPVTTSGLLAGLWVLQGALGPLARHGPDQLNAMLETHLPLFATKK
jgi:hypothetical protein